MSQTASDGTGVGRLRGTRIAIVGGSCGIGLAIAAAAQAEGAIPLIGARDRSRREAALAELGGATAEARAVDADSAESVENFFATAGALDHLVVSVAGPETEPRPFVEGDIAHARAHFDATYWTACRLIHAFLARTGWRADRSVLIVTGALSRRPLPGKSAYTSAQWALEGLARALVGEVTPLRVNILVPGLVRSPRWDAIAAPEREAMFEQAAREMPVGFVPPASAVASLAVEAMANSYINGAALVADGGWSVGR